MLRVAGKVAVVAGAAADAYSIATADDKAREITLVAGGWGGAYAGAKTFGAAGAFVGTFFGGPIGAIVGGAVGGVVGGAVGYWGDRSSRRRRTIAPGRPREPARASEIAAEPGEPLTMVALAVRVSS